VGGVLAVYQGAMNYTQSTLFHVSGLSLFLLAVMIFQCAVKAEAVDPKVLIDMLSKRDRGIANISYTVEWIDFMKANDMFPEHRSKSVETFFQDKKKGKYLLRSQKQLLDKSGKIISSDEQAESTELLSDGTLGVHYDIFPKLDNKGRLTPKKEIPVGYHSVQITEENIVKDVILSLKKPFGFANQDLIPALKSAMDTRTPLSINREGEIITVSGVDFQDNPAYKNGSWTAKVDVSKGNVVTNIDVFYASKNLARVVQCDYVQTDGFWQESAGAISMFKDSATKDLTLEWKFTVKKMQVNDPAFSSNVFDIKLPAGASVSDVRFGVTYNIGSDGAMTSDLERLSREASGMKFPSRVQSILSPILMWSGVVLVLVLLACILRCYAWFKASRTG